MQVHEHFQDVQHLRHLREDEALVALPLQLRQQPRQRLQLPAVELHQLLVGEEDSLPDPRGVHGQQQAAQLRPVRLHGRRPASLGGAARAGHQLRPGADYLGQHEHELGHDLVHGSRALLHRQDAAGQSRRGVPQQVAVALSVHDGLRQRRESQQTDPPPIRHEYSSAVRQRAPAV